MKIEIEPQVESAIRASLPPDGSVHPLFLNGWLDFLIGQLGLPEARSEYTTADLETLGCLTADAILKEGKAPSGEPPRYTVKDMEIIESYANEARGGVNKVIDELSIAAPAKRFLRGSLDNIALHYDYAGVQQTELYKSVKTGMHVIINIPSVFEAASYTSRQFGGENWSQSLFKGLLYYETAHEFGHAIHCALTEPKSDAPRAWHDKKLFEGYPLTMIPEGPFQQYIADELYRTISYERFAQFFGWEVLRGFGLSGIIRLDYVRTNAMKIFGNGFTFSQMDHFVDGCEQRMYAQEDLDMLTASQKQERHELEQSLIGALIIYSVSLYHTYGRETVEELINKGWRGKRRELARQQYYEQRD